MRTKLLTSLSLFVLACGPGREPPDGNPPPPLMPIEKTSALEAANRNFRSVVVGAATAGGFAEGSALLDLLPFGSDVACDPEGGCPEAPTSEEQATEMADELATRILTVANVTVEEPTRLVLMLKPEVYCTTTSSSGTSAQSCMQALTQVPVKLELTSRRENDIDAALTVGTYSVASVQFYRDRFGVELDLAGAMNAAKAMAQASGEPIDTLEGNIRGRIRVELLLNGNNDFTLSLSIISPIDIDATLEGDTVSIDIGTSTPLASVRIDGNGPRLVFESNIGAIQMTLPLKLFSGDAAPCSPNDPSCEPPPEITGILGIRVEPTSAKVTLDASDTVKVDRYQTGGATMTFDGTPLFSYTLNSGQPISGSFTTGEAGTTVSVSPMLDARAEMDLQPLVEQLSSDFPSQLLRDTLQLMLNGAPEPTVRTRTVQRSEVDENGNTITIERTLFEVVQGRLSLSSSAAGKTVVVDAGMCLDAIEAPPDEEPHPFELLVEAVCE